MRNAPNLRAEKFRDHHASMGISGTNQGAFAVPLPPPYRGLMRVIISDGGGWDHVSVSLASRCPTWGEMVYIKDLFFKDDEVVMQLHPAKSDHRNLHSFCLHLWRPQTAEEHQRHQDEYRKDRKHLSEEERRVYDPIELDNPTPGPIPLPPGVMVAPREGEIPCPST